MRRLALIGMCGLGLAACSDGVTVPTRVPVSLTTGVQRGSAPPLVRVNTLGTRASFFLSAEWDVRRVEVVCDRWNGATNRWEGPIWTGAIDAHDPTPASVPDLERVFGPGYYRCTFTRIDTPAHAVAVVTFEIDGSEDGGRSGSPNPPPPPQPPCVGACSPPPPCHWWEDCAPDPRCPHAPHPDQDGDQNDDGHPDCGRDRD